MNKPSTTIVLNGFWAKIVQAILLASLLAGASGLVVALRMSWAADSQAVQISDHEIRLRALEADIGTVKAGVQVLLERTTPASK